MNPTIYTLLTLAPIVIVILVGEIIRLRKSRLEVLKKNLDLIIGIENFSKNAYEWRRKYARLYEKYQALNEGISRAAQAEAKRILGEWEPDPAIVEADFAKAEFMANNREMRDAGRKTKPRDDQEGEPAIVRKVLPRKRQTRKP